MSIEKHVILKTLDTPLKILFWTVPELLMFLVPPFLGLMIDQLTLGIVSSLMGSWKPCAIGFCQALGALKACPLLRFESIWGSHAIFVLPEKV